MGHSLAALVLLVALSSALLLAQPACVIAQYAAYPPTPEEGSLMPRTGNGSASLAFAVPEISTGYDATAFGSPRYRVELETADGTSLGCGASAVAVVAGSPAYLVGLGSEANGAVARFSVVAENGRGEVDPDAQPVRSVPFVIGAPDVPQSLHVRTIDSALRVMWVAGGDNAAPTTSFTVHVTPAQVAEAAAPVSVEIPFASSTASSLRNASAVVAGLQNYVAYEIAVVARNAMGESLPAALEAPVAPQSIPDNLLVGAGERVELESGTTRYGSVSVELGGHLMFSVDSELEVGVLTVSGEVSGPRVSISAYRAVVHSGGTVNADAAITAVGPGAATNSLAGASHGGLAQGASRPAYGSPLAPTEPGSTPRSENRAGGVVRLEVNTGFVLNGRVSADATTANDAYGGASGGSVWLECGDISGNGEISAAGGRGRDGDGSRTGGAGGRVAVYSFATSSFEGTVSASGGGHSVHGERPGTVLLSLPGVVDTEQVVVPPGAMFRDLYFPSHVHLGVLRVGAGGSVGFIGGSRVRTEVLSFAEEAAGSRLIVGAITAPTVPRTEINVTGDVLFPSSVSLDASRAAVLIDSGGTIRFDGAQSASNAVELTAAKSIFLSGEASVSADTVVVNAGDTFEITTSAGFVGSARADTSLLVVSAPSSRVFGTASAARVRWFSDSLSVVSATALNPAAIHSDGLSSSTIGTPEGPNSRFPSCSYTACAPAASHGGWAGYAPYHAPPYGDPLIPTSMGSRGYYHSSYTGGGAILINVTGELHVSEFSRISAHGFPRVGYWFGGGSGGSVLVQAGSLAGAGSIAADGGNANVRSSTGGAGGRVAAYVTTTTSFAGSIQAIGGDSPDGHGGPRGGTVHISIPGQIDVAAGTLRVPAGCRLLSLYVPSAAVDTTLEVVELADGARVEWLDSPLSTRRLYLGPGAELVGAGVVDSRDMNVQVTDEFVVMPSALLAAEGVDRHLVVKATTAGGLVSAGLLTSVGGSVTLQVSSTLELQGEGSVDALSSIDVAALKLLISESTASIRVRRQDTGRLTVNVAGDTVVNGTASAANVHWNASTLTLGHYSAAVHADGFSSSRVGTARELRFTGCDRLACPPAGSHGGVAGGLDFGPTYGDPINPVTPGSRGYYRETGGGVVLVDVETMHLVEEARVSAHGNPRVASWFGGGSGGSVQIHCEELSGSGEIVAHGGNGGNRDSIGGAGGRVAVFVQRRSTFDGLIAANGGGFPQRDGTVYAEIPDQILPDQGVFTPLPGLSVGPVFMPSVAARPIEAIAVNGDSLVTWAGTELFVKVLNVSAQGVFRVNSFHENSPFALHVHEPLCINGVIEANEGRGLRVSGATALGLCGDSSLIQSLEGSVTLNSPVVSLSGESAAVRAKQLVSIQADTLDVRGTSSVVAVSASDSGRLVVDAKASIVLVGTASAALVEWTAPSVQLVGSGAVLHANGMSTSQIGMPFDVSESASCDRLQCFPSASHAGMGLGWNLAPTYGSALSPDTPGSRGGYTAANGGGGIVRITADSLSIDEGARLQSHGWPLETANWYGAGSGGSVVVKCKSLQGSGVIAAHGGAGGNRNSRPGGGGRVGVFVSESADAWAGTVEAHSGGVTSANSYGENPWDSTPRYTFIGGAGTAIFTTAATGQRELIVANRPRVAEGYDAAETIVADEMSSEDALSSLVIVDAHLVLGEGASLRTREVTTRGSTSTLSVTSTQSLVILNDPCSAIDGSVDYSGPRAVVFKLDDQAPVAGSVNRGTVLTGVISSEWPSVSCQFGKASHVVEATLTPSPECAESNVFECAVPADPHDSGRVVVTLSVDGGITLHNFDPPHFFRFKPEAACDSYGTAQFPDGCTVDMLGDGECDSVCNVRACAFDNRDCGEQPVFVHPTGDDGASGAEGEPVASLSKAVQLACSGFSRCLPISLLPGNYTCSHALFSSVEKDMLISAADPERKAPVLSCQAGAIALQASKLQLQGVDLQLAIELSNSVLLIRSSNVTDSASLISQDSVIEFVESVVSSKMLLEVQRDSMRLAIFEESQTADNAMCPTCTEGGVEANTVSVRDSRLLLASGELDVQDMSVEAPSAGSLAYVAFDGTTLSCLTGWHVRGSLKIVSGAASLCDGTIVAPTTLAFATEAGRFLLDRMLVQLSNGGIEVSMKLHGGVSSSFTVFHEEMALQSLAVSSMPSMAPLAEATQGVVKVSVDGSAVDGPGPGFVLQADVVEVHITNTVLSNLRGESGGAVSATGELTVTIAGSETYGCSGRLSLGGALRLTSTSPSTRISIVDSMFHHNYALGGGGGAVALVGDSVAVIEASLFYGNEGFGGGGALHVAEGASVSMNRCNVTDNVDSIGGGIYAVRATVVARSTLIEKNEAFSGANAYVRASTAELLNCTLSDGNGYIASGVMVFDGSTVSIEGSTLRRNVASDRGGALVVSLDSSASLHSVVITDNVASEGAAIVAELSASVHLEGCFVSQNSGQSASVLVETEAELVLKRSSIASNRITADSASSRLVPNSPAGVICSGQGSISMDGDSVVSGNWPYNLDCFDCNVTASEAAGTIVSDALCHMPRHTVSVYTAELLVLDTAGGTATLRLDGVRARDATDTMLSTYVSGSVAPHTELDNGTTVVQIPPALGVDHTIQVLVEGHHATGASSYVSFAYEAPTVTSAQPAVLPKSGGWLVLTGAGFGPPSTAESDDVSVSINGVPCRPLYVTAHSSLRCLAGPGSGLQLPVSVLAGGQLGVGATISVAQADVPEPPSFVDISVSTASPGGVPAELVVSVSVSDTGSVPLESFRIQYRPTHCLIDDGAVGVIQQPLVISSPFSPVVVGDLVAGCVYVLEASVVNVAGLESATRNASGVIVAVAPAAPFLMQITPAPDWPTGMLLAVAIEGDGGAPIVSYAVSVSLSASFDEHDIIHLPRSNSFDDNGLELLHLQDLRAHTVYYLRVAATNAAGTGEFSAPVVATALLGVPSAPVQLISAEFLGDFAVPQVRVTFLPPADDGGLEIVEYRVTAVPTGAADTDAVTFSNLEAVPSTSVIDGVRPLYVIAGPLQVGGAYFCTVAASNGNRFVENSFGDESEPSELVLVAGPPEPPSLRAEPVHVLGFSDLAGLADVELAWSAGEFRGGPVLQYELSAWRVSDPSTTWTADVSVDGVDADADLSSSVLVPFGNATRYSRAVRVAVRAVNAFGVSHWSSTARVDLPCRTGFGTEALSDRSFCGLCPPGFWVPAGQTNGILGAACQPCEPGSFSSAAGSTACQFCAIGSYQPLAQRDTCLPAPPGSVTAGEGQRDVEFCGVGEAVAPNRTVCQACPSGWASGGERSDACFPCEVGWVPSDDQGVCLRCPAGSVTDAPASAACRVCDPGSVAVEAGMSRCTECPPGFYETGDRKTCAACPAGAASSSAASISCEACPVGYVAPEEGQARCLPCPAGEFEDGTRRGCSRCGPGTVSPSQASSHCTPCEPGLVAVEAGSTICVPCLTGERAVFGTRCEACPAGHYVSADGSKCIPCPEQGASCHNGVLSLQEGYWSPQLAAAAQGAQSSATAVTVGGTNGSDAAGLAFYKCMPGACIFDSNGTLTCASGRTGTLCAVCLPNHEAVGTECVPCSDDSSNWILLAILLGGLASATIVVVRRAVLQGRAITERRQLHRTLSALAQRGTEGNVLAHIEASSASKMEKTNSLLMPMLKVLLNFLQAMSFMSSFEIPWTPAASTLWTLASTSSSIPINAAFVSCSLQWSYFERFRLAASAPVVVALLLLVLPLVNFLRTRKLTWTSYIVSFSVIFYLIYMTVTREALRLLNCSSPVEGVRYLKADYRVLCDTWEYDVHSAIAVAVLLGFCIGFPAWTYVMLRRERRRRLSMREVPESFAFMTQGYKPEHSYYEVVVMIRKLSLVSVAVLQADSDNGLQVFSGLGVVVLFLLVQLAVRPFVNSTHHIMDALAQIVAAASLYCGILLNLLEDDEENAPMRSLVSWSVVLINVGLAVAFAYILLTAVRSKAKRVVKTATQGIRKVRTGPRDTHRRRKARGVTASGLGTVPANFAKGELAWRTNPLRRDPMLLRHGGATRVPQQDMPPHHGDLGTAM